MAAISLYTDAKFAPSANMLQDSRKLILYREYGKKTMLLRIINNRLKKYRNKYIFRNRL